MWFGFDTPVLAMWHGRRIQSLRAFRPAYSRSLLFATISTCRDKLAHNFDHFQQTVEILFFSVAARIPPGLCSIHHFAAGPMLDDFFNLFGILIFFDCLQISE